MSKRESTYLDMCPELAHMHIRVVDAAQGGERAAVKSLSCKLPSRTLNTPTPEKN
jgi:hypothetical protein